MNGATPQCPSCESIELRRQARIGLWQRHIACRLGYFPWECGQCREVYLLKLRSSGYRNTLAGPKRETALSRVLLKDQK